MEIETTLSSSKKNNDLAQKTVYSILFSISFAHLLNDLIQAIIPSIYPILKQNYDLSFSQIGLITFAFQLTASIFQPFVGYYTDKHPKPFSQIYGMLFSWPESFRFRLPIIFIGYCYQ
jgi:FSR family fosmidomycin resistance protein-like MFS transporter